MSRIVITGAAGTIGGAVVPLLRSRHQLTLIDLRRPPDAFAGDRWFECDVRDRDRLATALEGNDTLIHLAGIPTEAAWGDLLAANIDGTQAVLEAAVASGVRRVMLASSIHAVGYASAAEANTTPPRPDTLYGVTKVAMEALGSLYADKFDMAIVSARICTFSGEPSPGRTLATWLSPGDAARLIEAVSGLSTPGHRLVWGVSKNEPRWFSLEAGNAIGYDPHDDALHSLRGAERSSAALPDPSQALGGPFVHFTLGHSPR